MHNSEIDAVTQTKPSFNKDWGRVIIVTKYKLHNRQHVLPMQRRRVFTRAVFIPADKRVDRGELHILDAYKDRYMGCYIRMCGIVTNFNYADYLHHDHV